jgi:hypothetical protein
MVTSMHKQNTFSQGVRTLGLQDQFYKKTTDTIEPREQFTAKNNKVHRYTKKHSLTINNLSIINSYMAGDISRDELIAHPDALTPAVPENTSITTVIPPYDADSITQTLQLTTTYPALAALTVSDIIVSSTPQKEGYNIAWDRLAQTTSGQAIASSINTASPATRSAQELALNELLSFLPDGYNTSTETIEQVLTSYTPQMQRLQYAYTRLNSWTQDAAKTGT